MKTIFKEGMKVYDSVFFPKSEGEVVKIEKKLIVKESLFSLIVWTMNFHIQKKGD